MALVGPFDRTTLLGRDAAFGRGVQPAHPIPCRRPRVDHPEPHPPSVARQRAVAEFLVPTLLADTTTVRSALGNLEACLDEQVVTWSPSMCTTTRTELVSALANGDDAMSDVSVTVVDLVVSGRDVHAEWVMAARFTRAAFLDDDILVEASGRTLQSAGMTVLGFVGPRVGSIRCYYDGLALLEQAMGPAVSSDDSASD
jgi:hypothetical protein